MHRLFPITCLTLLTKQEKEQLLAEGIVLCKTLYEKKELLKKYINSKARIASIEREISELIT